MKEDKVAIISSCWMFHVKVQKTQYFAPWNMLEAKSEVFLWLCSISNGLGLERLAKEFESRGFRKTSYLKYIRSSDLGVLLPSPHKLLLAEKKIIESKLEQLKQQENPGQNS